MDAKEIVKIGNPVLRQRAEKIPATMIADKKFQKFLEDMVSVMHQAEGVGLAANQVGHGVQAFVMECKANARYPNRPDFPLQTYLNPRIVERSQEEDLDWEGCLSIPGYRGAVSRACDVTLEAVTLEGKSITKNFSGFEARVVQHEVDHLNGFFYMDRMKDLKSWSHLDEFNKMTETKIREGE